MTGDSIEKLYKYYGILADAGDNIVKHEDLYSEIIQAAKGDQSERRLACQFIPRFFIHFPNLGETALNSLFDLCEDPEISIRKQVIKELPHICKQCTMFTKKTSYILSQLLQSKDLAELSIVSRSLLSLFQIYPEGAVAGLFNQIRNGEDTVRDKCLSFLTNKVKSLPIANLPKLEEALITETKSTFDEASPEEIPIFMDILFWTKLGKDVTGHTVIINMIAEQIESETPFNVHDDDLLERLVTLCKSVKPLFKPLTSPDRYVTYFCKEVLPNFKSISGYDECSGYALELLQLFTELTVYCNKLNEPVIVVESIFNLLIEVMPYSESGQDNFDDLKFHFSYIECLLYSLHKLFKLHPSFLSDDVELSKFRSRLQYFSRALQGYIKTLHNAIKSESLDALKKPENAIKTLALKTTLNINALIKDFFYNPPSNKATIQLSWLIPKACQNEKAIVRLKRMCNSLGVEIPAKRSNTLKPYRPIQRPLYQPPNGKYSKTF
ncbi:apoptosis inhibitor 5 isoform X2 [Cimex lectularius]|nr:apoptosis inhibitor 5 isoform X2 [Cimex lectularius]